MWELFPGVYEYLGIDTNPLVYMSWIQAAIMGAGLLANVMQSRKARQSADKATEQADPWEQARAQKWLNTQAMLEEMKANQYGTSTPWGQVNWDVDPNDPFKRTRRFSLSDRSKAHLARKGEAHKAAYAKVMGYLGATPSAQSLTVPAPNNPAPPPAQPTVPVLPPGVKTELPKGPIAVNVPGGIGRVPSLAEILAQQQRMGSM